MYIHRFLEKEIEKYISKREIIAITGPRQSGKTTLLKYVYNNLKKAIFLDFEDREILELFDEDIKSFVELYVKPNDFLFIDEFQYAKEGGKNLKYIFDNHKIKIFISGSSVSEMTIQSVQFLVGRIFVLELLPFSFEEFLSYREPNLYGLYKKGKISKQVIDKLIPYFEEFCIFGGFPRVVMAGDKEEKTTVLRNIYNTYFLKEVKQILNLKSDYKLSKLIHALALQIGNLINYNELSATTGFNHNELLEYMNILEKTYISRRSLPFHTNKRVELVKTPKIFFLDNGFRNITLKNFQPIKDRSYKSMLYENFVASEIIKKNLDLKYWRTKSKAEVDFIVEKDGKIMPIEIKSNLKKPTITKSFHSFMEKYKPKNAYIFSEKLLINKGIIKFRPIFSIQQELTRESS